MNTLWRKTWRDLWLFKARTMLVVLAIAVGTAATGVAVTSLIVLRRDLRDGYRATNPAHAILDTSPFDPALAARVAERPGVAAAEARRQTSARLAFGDETRQLVLWTLPDDAPTVGRLGPQDGAPLPPPPGTILLERSVRSALPIAVGDTVTLRLGDGDAFRLTVAGFVNDMAVPPTTVQPTVFGYVADATAARLGLPREANQLYVRLEAEEEESDAEKRGGKTQRDAEEEPSVSSSASLRAPLRLSASLFSSLAPGPWNLEPDRADVEAVATEVTDWLAHEGVVVARAGIPEPGVHLMQGNVDTGLLMVGILGGLTLLLSAFLVANVVGAVIAQQTPQIGVLKALGGGRGLVLRLYGRMVLIFGGLALLLAVPLGLVGAWFMSSTLATQLNYDIPSFGLTAGALLAQAAGALLVPALAALGPLLAAARLPVRSALAGEEKRNTEKHRGKREGHGGRGEGRGETQRSAEERRERMEDSSSASLRVFSPRLSASLSSSLAPRLALRNVARRPARLALTVAALALAGALFMATFGLRLGLYEAVEILVGEFPSDVIIDLEQPQAVGRLRRAAEGLDGIARVELWGVADARRLYPDGRAGSSFTLYGVPPTTQIAPFAERAGRWLGKDEGGGMKDDSSFIPPPSSLYINYEAEKLLGRPGVGEALDLRLNGREDVTTRLVGISLRPFDALAYMPLADFEQATGQRGRAGRIVLYLEEESDAEKRGEKTQRDAEEELSDSSSASLSAPPRLSASLSSFLADELTARLEAAGIAVARTETADGQRAAYRAQFDTLVVLLMSLAGLTALVGGLGLGNTMALNVLERSREIGVLRALGGRRPLLRRLVLVEGLLIALSSAALAVPLAVPLTLALDRVMGVSLLGSPLTFAFSLPAAAGWLGLVLLIAVVACWLPAERAGRMAVREALAYE